VQRSGSTAAGASSAEGTLARIMSAARTHGWGISPGLAGGVMATRGSGLIGQPWVVVAERAGRGMRVSLYRPGDALDVEGDAIGELRGNPREMGRQLRTILEDLPG